MLGHLIEHLQPRFSLLNGRCWVTRLPSPFDWSMLGHQAPIPSSSHAPFFTGRRPTCPSQDAPGATSNFVYSIFASQFPHMELVLMSQHPLAARQTLPPTADCSVHPIIFGPKRLWVLWTSVSMPSCLDLSAAPFTSQQAPWLRQ